MSDNYFLVHHHLPPWPLPPVCVLVEGVGRGQWQAREGGGRGGGGANLSNCSFQLGKDDCSSITPSELRVVLTWWAGRGPRHSGQPASPDPSGNDPACRCSKQTAPSQTAPGSNRFEYISRLQTNLLLQDSNKHFPTLIESVALGFEYNISWLQPNLLP